ncbi:HlyD family secretion protein [Mesoterricola sediminis]|uniref:RND transporter n=1 Tax=Mesoterricola sediminis TaxID=2927980 RepID=A0AA48KFZ3_9BACT|nr:HlyD family secretion protein [Mesoterricola sediminis]BDU76928.1 RND transporter [Mesoterricola sediminis]
MTEITEMKDNSRRDRTRLALTAAAVVAVLAAGAGWYHFKDRVSTDDAQVDGHLVPVSAKVGGSVERIAVEDNQPVKAGDVLVELDARDLQARVDQARAALAQAEAQASSASADVDRSRVSLEQARSSELQVAEANLEARRSTFEKAKADVVRTRPLADRQEISAQQFDAYRNAAEVAENEWKAAQRRLAGVKQEADIRRAALSASEARTKQASAGIAAAKANLDALLLQIGYTRIVAPVDGVVTRKTVEPGQIIQPGQGLLTLVPLHQTWVTANFKETQLKNVRPGQKAEVEVDMNGMTLHGTVDSVAGSTGSRMSLLPPENAVGNFVKVVQRIPVKIRLDKEDADKVILRPGMNVDATILTK